MHRILLIGTGGSQLTIDRRSPTGSAVARWLKSRTAGTKRVIVAASDLAVVFLAFGGALFLRLGYVDFNPPLARSLAVALLVVVPLLWLFGLYDAVFRHVGRQTALRIGQAVGAFALPWMAIITTIGFEDVPRTLGLLYPLVLWLGLVGTRNGAQWLLRRSEPAAVRKAAPAALIYGAGSAGRQLAAAIDQSGEMRSVAFVDDDPDLQGRSIDRRPIVGPDTIGRTIEDLGVTHVLLALPLVSRSRRNEIISLLKPFSVQVKTLPGLMHIAHGRVDAADLRDLDIEDLLGRDRVDPDRDRMAGFARDKVVLVSGAGGSIGSELCRQIMALSPATLLLVERSEHALYEIHRELADELRVSQVELRLVPLLASVTDAARIDRILATWRPDAVFHAAAYKHVPLVEANPLEGAKNNVFGTLVLARAAIAHGCGHFVLVSTDKAVRPTNVMGATKRLAEIVCQALAGEAGTVITMVRFGNVLGSSGSVVPLFRRQIAAGGPVTVTHREMTRYFMLISEAAQLVIQAGAMARGGELFLLEMGAPVRIWDLACNMIQLAGARPRLPGSDVGEIEVVETGLRPGEKLYEELLIDDDARPTEHPLILSADEPALPAQDLWPQLEELGVALETQDAVGAVALLQRLVPEFAYGGLADAVLIGSGARATAAAAPRPSPLPSIVRHGGAQAHG